MLPVVAEGLASDERRRLIDERRNWVQEQSISDPVAGRMRSFAKRLDYPDITVDSIARGFVLVEYGLWNDGSCLQVEASDVIQFNRFQIERVKQDGHCDGGCALSKIIETKNGRTVCSYAFEPCPFDRLNEIILAIGEINKPKNPEYDVKGFIHV